MTIKFEFIQPSEFEDPYYDVIIDNDCCGNIGYQNGRWLGSVQDDYLYDAVIFHAIANKIDQLNVEV